MVAMFDLFSIAVSSIKNCSFCSYKFIKVDGKDTFSSKLTTLALDRFTHFQVTFQQTYAHLLVMFNTWTSQMLMKFSLQNSWP